MQQAFGLIFSGTALTVSQKVVNIVHYKTANFPKTKGQSTWSRFARMRWEVGWFWRIEWCHGISYGSTYNSIIFKCHNALTRSFARLKQINTCENITSTIPKKNLYNYTYLILPHWKITISQEAILSITGFLSSFRSPAITEFLLSCAIEF